VIFGQSLIDLTLILAVTVAVGCLLIALIFPYLSDDRTKSRVAGLSTGGEKKESRFSFRKCDDQEPDDAGWP
jgi:hypothetical protein